VQAIKNKKQQDNVICLIFIIYLLEMLATRYRPMRIISLSFWGCTRLADMLSLKYKDNALKIKEKSME
jgi:hypothetical protein